MNSDAKRVAVGYIRTSTKKQEDSPEAQLAALEEWAGNNEVELRAVYQEQISSGVPLYERAKLLDAIEALKPGEMLLSVARDRFARDGTKMVLIERLLGFAGAKVATLDGLGGDGPDSVMLRGMKDVIAAWERTQAALRTRRVMHSKRLRGEKISRIPPYGYKHVGQRVVRHPGEQATIRVVVAWRNAGSSWAEICGRLNEGPGHPPRGTTWHIGSVRRIVKAAEAKRT